jgi:hypothetical protein
MGNMRVYQRTSDKTSADYFYNKQTFHKRGVSLQRNLAADIVRLINTDCRLLYTNTSLN